MGQRAGDAQRDGGTEGTTPQVEVGRFLAGIGALLRRPVDGEYLLLKRAESKDYAGGTWECVTGRVNQGEGFTFQFKNMIESGSISGVTKLAVDDEERSLEGVTVCVGEKTRPVTEISWSSSLYVPYGATITIYVPGALGAGLVAVDFVVLQA